MNVQSPDPTTSAAGDVPAADPKELPFYEPVPGDRLGVPLGSTRRIWEPNGHKPSYVFLVGLSVFSLFSDIASKLWAEKRLDQYPGMVEVWKDHAGFFLARNKGGAWGLLQTTDEGVRRPFFLLVSVAAIAFIVTLYRRLQPRQRALKWGLPLVLGGALGNVFDRVRYGYVIDFIDVHMMYKGADKHWPTFNVADVAICVGVALMAIDMFTSKKRTGLVFSPPVPPAQAGEIAATFAGVPVTASGGVLAPIVPVGPGVDDAPHPAALATAEAAPSERKTDEANADAPKADAPKVDATAEGARQEEKKQTE